MEIDMTENKLFSLTDQTKKVLESLDKNITIYGLYKPGGEPGDIVSILRRYQAGSDKIRLEYIDPDKNPALVKRFDTEGKGIPSGSLIVDGGTSFRVIRPFDMYDLQPTSSGQPRITGLAVEPRLTSALLYITSGYTPVIYELTGHGEESLANFGLTPVLENENYTIKELNLAKTASVPADASVIVIISPKFDLPAAEAEKITAFLEQGGRGIFLFDFLSFKPMEGFGSILSSFGVAIEPGIVMEGDPDHLYSTDFPNFIAPDMAHHETLNPIIENSLGILLPNTQPIKILEMKKRELEIISLLSSTKRSWLRTVENPSPAMLPTDIPGPFDTAVAISKKKFEVDEPEGYRILVAGTAAFLAPNPLYGGQLKGNMEFFINGLSWVNSRSQTISIRSKSLFKIPLRINALQGLIYSGIVTIIIPLIIIIIGLVIWLKRRHL
jgi:hypothetical protein